jgi:putative PIN family toxin of toxin-antitoxin system
VFLDTNVLLSAFLAEGLCSALFKRLIQRQSEDKARVIIGEPVLGEFRRIAQEKFRVHPDHLQNAMSIMAELDCAPASGAQFSGSPDPDDAPILACALAAQADLFVTGNKALLDMKTVEGMAIVSPRGCWERMSKG